MFKRLRDFFRDLFATPPPKGFSPPIPHPDPIGALCWREPGDPRNPFAVRILDCFSTAMGLPSLSENAATTRTYGRLRSDDGHAHIGTLPNETFKVECDLSYPSPEDLPDGPLHKSAEMEDKWDIYLYENRLYFSRSWTGELIFVAQVAIENRRLRVRSLWGTREFAFNDNSTFALRQVDFLIKALLQGLRVPAPLPSHEPLQDPETVAVYLFRIYGRHAVAGTYADTLGLAPPNSTGTEATQ